MPGEVKRGPGRPKKIQPESVGGIETLVSNPIYFRSDMENFFRRGNPRQLQRWFIASGDPQKAELIAAHMVEWFRDKLASLIPRV